MQEPSPNPDSPAASPFIRALIGKEVVLDTAGPITFLGRLAELEPHAFILTDADIRDGREGHVTKDKYICDAHAHGIQPNRKRLLVIAASVISISALEDVVGE